MAIQMREVDDLATDIVEQILRHKQVLSNNKNNKAPNLEAEQRKELVEITGNIWLVWVFRALVFNRSCSFVMPRRVEAGGKEYNMISPQWLHSQLRVQIT